MINKKYLHQEYTKQRKRIQRIVQRLETKGIDASAYIPPKIRETASIDLDTLEALEKLDRKSILRDMYIPYYTNAEQIRQAIVEMEHIIMPISDFAKYKSKYLHVFDTHYENQTDEEYNDYISKNANEIKDAIKGVERASGQEEFDTADAQLIYLLNYSEQVSWSMADELDQIEQAGFVYE